MLKQRTEAVKCSTCRWFGDGNVHGVPPMDGACHYHPPFPRVRPEDWCSHWAPQHEGDPTLEQMTIRLLRMLCREPMKCATEAPVSGEAPITTKTCDTCRYFPENINIECRKAKRRVTEKDHCLWWSAIQRSSGIFVYSWWQLANPKIGQEIWR